MKVRKLVSWSYGIGITTLPVIYTSLMLWTNQPVEWQIVILTICIVSPILVFKAAIHSIESQFESAHTLVRDGASSAFGSTGGNGRH